MESIRGAAKEHGIEVGEVKVDFKRVITRSREAADKLSKGVRFLLRKNKVDYIEASASIAGPQYRRAQPGGGQTASARRGDRGRTHPDRDRLGRAAVPRDDDWRRRDDQPRGAPPRPSARKRRRDRRGRGGAGVRAISTRPSAPR